MRRLLVLCLLVLTVAAVPAIALSPGDTVLVNRAPNGTHPGPGSFDFDVSGDGRCVVFTSSAAAMPGATGQRQVYLRDTVAGTTTLVSVSTTAGVGGNDVSDNPSVTPDCRFVAFDSDATNIVSPATTGRHVYRRDLQTGTTVRVSLATGGTAADRGSFTGVVSDNGNRVAFVSTATNLSAADDDRVLHYDVYVRDIGAATTTLATATDGGAGQDGNNGAGFYPTISGDGTKVAFSSDAANLSTDDVPADDTRPDVYVKNLTSGAVTLVARQNGASGAAADALSAVPEISGDGTRVAFVSRATNLGSSSGVQQVYVRELATHATTLVSRSAGGAPANADSGAQDGVSLSADGDVAAFTSTAGNLNGAAAGRSYMKDLSSGALEVASRGPGGAVAASAFFSILSGDGSHIAFVAFDGLVPDDTESEPDIHLRHHVLGAGPGPAPTPTPTAVPTASATPEPTVTPPAWQTIRGAQAFTQGTANDLYLACTKLDLYLVDVLPSGKRVSVTGAADLRLAGRTADILLDGKKVGTARIGAGGAFAARVAAPKRKRRAVARYQARVGTTASQKLRLVRRMVATTLTRSGGNLVLRGVVNPPRASKQPAIQVERFLSCQRREKVKVPPVKPGKGGRFSVRIKVPAGSRAVLYRARTKVPSRPGRPATKGTFTLPRAADVG